MFNNVQFAMSSRGANEMSDVAISSR